MTTATYISGIMIPMIPALGISPLACALGLDVDNGIRHANDSFWS